MCKCIAAKDIYRMMRMSKCGHLDGEYFWNGIQGSIVFISLHITQTQKIENRISSDLDRN